MAYIIINVTEQVVTMNMLYSFHMAETDRNDDWTTNNEFQEDRSSVKGV